MKDSIISTEIENLPMIPHHLTGGIFVLELLAITLLFAGTIILFTSSTRPGRVMMLVGLAFSTLCSLLSVFISGELDFEISRFDKLVIWYLPLASSLFMCVGCYGFFKFALSFKQES